MNTVYKFLIAALLSSSPLYVFADEKEATATAATTATPKFETYTNTERNYSLEYPSDWKKNDVAQLDLVLFAPPKEQEGKTRASMNVVSEKVGQRITLEEFYSESANNLTSSLKEVHVEKSGNQQINGINTKWILYTHEMQGIKFRVLQYFIVSNETIYLITFSTAADDFENYRHDFEKIANSFKLLAANPSGEKSDHALPAEKEKELAPAK